MRINTEMKMRSLGVGKEHVGWITQYIKRDVNSARDSHDHDGRKLYHRYRIKLRKLTLIYGRLLSRSSAMPFFLYFEFILCPTPPHRPQGSLREPRHLWRHPPAFREMRQRYTSFPLLHICRAYIPESQHPSQPRGPLPYSS